MPRFLIAAALVPLAAVVSGCGWTATSRLTLADGPRLSRADFASRVEAACERRHREIAALPRPRAKRDRRGFFANVAAIERDEAVALASVRPPRHDEAAFAQLAAASAELADVAERFLLAVVRNDPHERRRALADADRASAEYDRAAKRLRLACRQSA